MSEVLRLEDNLVTLARSHPSAACEAIQFYGNELHVALSAAAEYLHKWELEHGYSPPVVALHDEFSWEDAGRDIAWQLTVILRDEVGSV
ncbi:hypothetical protein [Jatrophihabitans sp.]|jgi:hypothetical protein|uniref:hypothetical protein n=1 Tax=Jatrophihabitans sp. TaxID=1932789 RepID=UPI002EF1003E